MKSIHLYRHGLVALFGAALVTGCTVTAAPPVGGPGVTPPGINPPPPPSGGPPPAPEQPTIFLQPNSFYNGRDSSGKKIRAFVSRSGEIIRVDSKTGRNFSQTYRYRSGNTYRSGNYSVTVTSARSFTWDGPFGNVTMND